MPKLLVLVALFALPSFADDYWGPLLPWTTPISRISVMGRKSYGDGLQRLFSSDSPISIKMEGLACAYNGYRSVADILGFQVQMGEDLHSVRIQLDLHSVPPAEALDAIAKASHTRWETVTDGDTTTLRVSAVAD